MNVRFSVRRYNNLPTNERCRIFYSGGRSWLEVGISGHLGLDGKPVARLGDDRDKCVFASRRQAIGLLKNIWPKIKRNEALESRSCGDTDFEIDIDPKEFGLT